MFEYERRDLFFQFTDVYCQTTNDDELQLHICGFDNSIWGIIAENVFVSEWSSDHEKVASEAEPELVRLYEALSLRYPVTQLLPWLQLEHSIDDREKESFHTLCKHSSSVSTERTWKHNTLLSWFLHGTSSYLDMISEIDRGSWMPTWIFRGGGGLNSKWFTITVLVCTRWCIRMSHFLTSALAPWIEY